jgi:glycosyltransferase involved in cell wall biosynthesis
MKKRILIVSPHIEGLGGISKVLAIWRDADFFVGHDVTYIPTTNDAFRSKLLVAVLAVCKFIINLPGADTVYIHCAAYTSFYRKSVFILLAGLFGKQCILHIHPNEFYDFIVNAPQLLRKYSLYVLGKIEVFVVLTEELLGRISQMFPGKPVYALRNAVNVKEMMNVQGVRRGETELIYLGWYIREKGVYELVDAIKILKENGIEVHLNFYGTKQIEQLTTYVHENNLNDVVSVHGWIDGEDKLRALHASTLLVLPSHSEGIPNVILEAMATKTPIVATCVGGIKEVLRCGENALIVEVNNAADLSEKIARMLGDRELRYRLAANAYREAKQKYDVSNIKQQFLTIIEGDTL